MLRKAFTISSYLVALILATYLGTLFHVEPALAAEKPADPHCKYQPRDDLGRCPLLTYKVVMSQDNAVCSKIARALSHAPAGPNELYSNPIFIPWRTDGLYDPIVIPSIDLPGPIWIAAPIFNDGHLVAVERSRSEAGLKLTLFPDGKAFQHFIMRDGTPPEGWYPNPVGGATTTPIIGPGGPAALRGFPLLPERYRNSWRWSGGFALRASARELHWANLDGTIYLVARIYAHEIIYVVKFRPNKTFDDVCYLAGDRWWKALRHKLIEQKGMD